MAATDGAPGVLRFDGRTVIVTGGGRGIGEATVHRFAAEGARVLLVDIDAVGADRVAGEVVAGRAPGEVTVCIADISTNAALAAIPGLGAYGAAKAGVIQLTRQIAVECAADGIRANSITPGVIMSPMIAALVGLLDRDALDADLVTGPGQPAQLAAVVAFLASDDASYVNGENIQVDGGWFAKREPGGMTFGIPGGPGMP